MLENELRKWVKKVWKNGPHLTWGEAGRGGTVGAADLLMPVGGLLMPVELKVCNTKHDLVIPKLRPSQLLYHRKLIKSGISAAYMFGFDSWEGPLVGIARMEVVVDAVMNDEHLDPECWQPLGAIKPFKSVGDWRKVVEVAIGL